MDEIVQEFLVESHENLDQLDRDLVELEQRPGERELLASIFRTIHTIKGTSGFLAFGQLEAVTHVGENLLARLRDGRMTMTQPAADALLRMVDVVRELLAAIEVDGTEGSVQVGDVVVAITAVLDAADQPQAEAPEEAAPVTLVAPAAPTPDSADPGEPALEGASLPGSAGTTSLEAPAQAPAPEPVEELVEELVEDDEDEEESYVEDVAAPSAPVAAPPAPPAPLVAESVVPAAELVPVVPEALPAPRAAGEDSAPRRSLADSSIRVDVDLLDTLMRLVGELVLTRNQIVRQTTDHAGEVDTELVKSSQRLNLIATELQEGVMKTRMQPIDHLWSKLPRVVRDLGAACGKQVELTMVGRETELDRTLLECVKDPLTHLVRNAVDHGLEAPQARVAAGKPAVGTLTLSAYHESGQVVVEVSDDGAGIDPQRIAAKAAEKGLRSATQLGAMTGPELLQLIFLPGFSTAAAVTNVSGRGVGMDVVKTNIENIGGTIELESELGKGTTLRLRIPLTLAIVPALTVECAGDTYAIPQVSLLELVALDADRAATAMENVNGAPVYRLRGALLPLVHLTEALGVESERSDGHVLIAVLHAEGKRFGLVIDRVLSTEEIVVKPLGTRIKALGTYTGATILGDGRIALILDVSTLARRAMATDALERIEQSTEETATLAEPNRMVVAGIGGERRVGIPLSQVTRLEHIPAHTVERVGNREVVQYRGAILPLLRLDRHLGGVPELDRDDLVVVVYTERERSVAIVVEHIVDIIEGDAEINSDIDDFGLLGSAVIRDRIVEVLDVRSAILAADPRFFSTAEDEYYEEAIR